MAWNRHSRNYSRNGYISHNFSFLYHIWSQIEATMCIKWVHNSRNGLYFLPLLRFLNETETWVCHEDAPWATYSISALFDNEVASYLQNGLLFKCDVINDVMSMWCIVCATISTYTPAKYCLCRISSSYLNRRDKHHDKQTHKHTGRRHHFAVAFDKYDEYEQTWIKFARTCSSLRYCARKTGEWGLHP